MTNPTSETVSFGSPRLICRVSRWWCAVANPRRTGHVAHCAECRSYFAAEALLTLALRREADEAESRAAEPDRTREIMRAVRQSKACAPTASSRRPLPLGLLAAGALAAVAAVMFIVNQTALPPSGAALDPETPIAGASAAAEAELLADAVGTLSHQLSERVIPSAGAIVAKNPLQDELRSVYSDARSALDFLAMNFLPRSAASNGTTVPKSTG